LRKNQIPRAIDTGGRGVHRQGVLAKDRAVDLINLPNHQIYLKLMIDGTRSPPFSAETVAPEEIAHLL
jgi:hypothetical protein